MVTIFLLIFHYQKSKSNYFQIYLIKKFSLNFYYCTVFPRSILQPQNPKHNFDAGNKHHLAHVKTFLTYTACVKVVFGVLAHKNMVYLVFLQPLHCLSLLGLFLPVLIDLEESKKRRKDSEAAISNERIRFKNES
ncbi:hypothetical protein BpHYR1_048356 [Brachionus plicatilis]|uniref:Uncharacterized protein n=1 Tax=Brachionus plicatilis TaxID=10195 RepID=A0A3M7QL78_BRAPC|nr:hypothetical protein BpHYR1_048356 [Brachionus plicatilis]